MRQQVLQYEHRSVNVTDRQTDGKTPGNREDTLQRHNNKNNIKIRITGKNSRFYTR